MKYTINMKTDAFKVKGQGVASACEEQIRLIKEGLSDKFEVTVNQCKKANITHYHTVNFNYFLSIPFAKLFGTTVGYVHFLPETMEQSLKLPKIAKKVFYSYLLRFYKSMDSLVTVNPYFIDRLADNGIDRARVTYIPNFVNDEDFYPVDTGSKKMLRDKYGIPSNQFTVICAGQLQTRKGIFDFVETAKHLPEIQFIWAGGFSFGKITSGYEEIKKLVENPPSNIMFTGIVDRKQMNEIYNLADVMFLPSYDELFPMTILEAMNCKLPILLRNLPIYENILFDYYLKESDTDEFVKAILKLSNDKKYYQAAQNASWRGHEFYNRDHVMTMWDDYYSGLIAENEKKALKHDRKIL